MADNVFEFTDANFQEAALDLEKQPVLVDFWAPWCGPCKQMLPTIEELAAEYDGKARIGKLNTDENQQTASSYQISAIPTVLVVKNGEVVERLMGLTPKAKFVEVLDKLVE
jgi:thioredoxin 1